MITSEYRAAQELRNLSMAEITEKLSFAISAERQVRENPEAWQKILDLKIAQEKLRDLQEGDG